MYFFTTIKSTKIKRVRSAEVFDVIGCLSPIGLFSCNAMFNYFESCRLLRITAVSSISSYSVFIRCCPFNRDGRIYPISSAIAHTPSLHLSRLRASSFFFNYAKKNDTT